MDWTGDLPLIERSNAGKVLTIYKRKRFGNINTLESNIFEGGRPWKRNLKFAFMAYLKMKRC